MTAAVERLLQISLTGGVLILAVLLLRLAARRAPRWITMALWVLVAVRFCCPVTVPVAYSPVPATVAEPPAVLTLPVTLIPQWNGESLEPIQVDKEEDIAVIEKELAQEPTLLDIAGWVWVTGMGVMGLCALISWWRLRRRVATAVRQPEGHWRCDAIGGPFVLGLFRPRIYLPFTVSEGDTPYVLAHEQAHIRRRDPLWKWLGFCLLTVYWFHPLMWLSYRLFCRDIELCCDARVTATLAEEEKGRYARALLASATRPTPGLACPVAFGETGVAARVKAVLSPKKPLLWVAAGALLVGTVATVFMLTVSRSGFEGISAGPYEGDPGVKLTLVDACNTPGEQSLTIRWEGTGEEQLHFGLSFSIQRKVDGQWQDLPRNEGIVFPGLAHRPASFHKLDERYGLSAHYGDLPEGRYRFTAPFTLGEGKNAKKGTAILPFTVSGFDPAGQSIPVEGVSLTLLSTNMTRDKQTLTALWKNKGDTDITYGEMFSLERKVDGQWKSIGPRDGVAFNAIGYMLSPGAEVEKTYQISGHYGILPNGEYRLVTDFAKGRNRCILRLPFTVTNSFDPEYGTVSADIRHFTYDRLGELTMTVGWHNGTSRSIRLDTSPFRLEQQDEDGRWHPLPVAVERATEPSELKNFQYTTVDYALGGRYRSLLPGDYRLVLSYTAVGQEQELALPFRIEDAPPPQAGEVTWQLTGLDTEEVTVALTNGTEHTDTHLAGSFRLYRQEGEQWLLLPAIAVVDPLPKSIPTGESGTYTFPLALQHGQLSPGTYRLSFDYTCGEESRVGMVDFYLPPS